MVLSYFMAQLLSVEQELKGYLLVLSAGNLDEGLRGYMTKYDCSSADLNPIGSLSKVDLKEFLKWCVKEQKLTSVDAIVNATPTAELRPVDESSKQVVQKDEDEMGMTYEELSMFGRLRKISKHGPLSMFKKLAEEWRHLGLKTISEKVKAFFKFYSINRHKMTVITPSMHAETYSADDNRYDLRQFLYNTKWPHQFHKINDLIQELEEHGRIKEKLNVNVHGEIDPMIQYDHHYTDIEHLSVPNKKIKTDVNPTKI